MISCRIINRLVRETLLSGKMLFGHDVLINGFVEAIEEDKPPPVSTVDGMNVVNTLCEVIQPVGVEGLRTQN